MIELRRLADEMHVQACSTVKLVPVNGQSRSRSTFTLARSSQAPSDEL